MNCTRNPIPPPRNAARRRRRFWSLTRAGTCSDIGAARAKDTTGRIPITESRSTTKATYGSQATAEARRPDKARAGPASAARRRADRSCRLLNDNMVLKFTQDGKFLMQIGKPGQTKGSNDVENLRLPAKMFVDPKTNELYVADGYGNHRVIVYDAETGKYKRHWGAYGHKPDDTDLGPYNPDAPLAQQFRNPVHCAELSHDNLLYVCDRVNDRIQVFQSRRDVREGKDHREEDARRRVGLGYRFLRRIRSRSTFTSAMARTKRFTFWTAIRWKS